MVNAGTDDVDDGPSLYQSGYQSGYYEARTTRVVPRGIGADPTPMSHICCGVTFLICHTASHMSLDADK